MLVELDVARPGNARRASASRIGRARDDLAVPRIARRRARATRSSAEVPLRALDEPDVTDVRRVEHPAEDERSSGTPASLRRPRPRRPSARPPDAAPPPAPPLPGAAPDDAVAAVGAEDAERRPLRLRPVDEVLGHLGLRSAASSGNGGQSEKSARRNASTPSPVAQESGKTASTPVASSNAGGSVSRSILFSTTHLGQLVEPGAVAPPARRDRPRSASSRSPAAASTTCTSSRARSRWARNSWPSPTPSPAPSISPGTSATTSWRPSGASTVPSTGSSVVNG